MLLELDDLQVEFGPSNKPFQAVDGVSLRLDKGQTLGLVGESGSGKSLSMLALMGLVDAPGRVRARGMRFLGQDLQKMSAAAKRGIIGKDISMIFQDPMGSLNPSFTVEFQIAETLRLHQGLRGAALHKRCLELLQEVEIPAAKSRLRAYPHELSGGMCQRVMIAMAIACTPKLLIADEPTTALDVTIQAQIIALLQRLQKAHNMALILISHDLAVVAQMAQEVAVMYAGQVVEHGAAERVFYAPQHPYTEALLLALPEMHSQKSARLHTLPGMVAGRW